MKSAPLTLATLVGAIILFGLLYTLLKAVEVAPHAKEAADGRLHYHSKNATRLTGSPDDVHRAVQRAVYLRSNESRGLRAPPTPTDWREAITGNLETAAPVRHVVGLPATDAAAPLWALPGAYWAVYAQAPVLFLERDSVDPATLEALGRYGAPLYVLAPHGLVSDEVLERLQRVAPVVRIAGATLPEHAVRIAEYRDWATGFGWGREGEHQDGYYQFALAAPAEAEHAYAALPLARSNAATFLFADDTGGLPGATGRYLWSQRARFFVTPSEGPFRHQWFIGNRISYGAQGRADFAVEKAPYASEENAPGAIILARQDLAQAFTAMHRVTHMPINAPMLFLDHSDRLSPETLREMRRLKPDGVAFDGRTQVYLIGAVDAAIAERIRSELGYEVRQFLVDVTDPARPLAGRAQVRSPARSRRLGTRSSAGHGARHRRAGLERAYGQGLCLGLSRRRAGRDAPHARAALR